MPTIQQRFDRFYSNLVNQKVEVSDSGNIYQCMDLAYLWGFALDIPKATIQHLYAYQVYTQPSDLTRQYFEVIPNSPTFVPRAGDLVVFSNRNLNGSYFNAAGHIGIATGGGDIYRFKSFDQNWIVGQAPTIVEHNYNNPKLLGVLRPKDMSITLPINDQSLYNFGEGFGILELQAAKSILKEQKEKIVGLENKVHDLTVDLSTQKVRIRTAVDKAIDSTN